ncbi:bifunctional DNA-formamidopyrimidine glycosylase/DNA-(apurinic or apyrimidinic site) lyase [Roseomonas alkaliterrae]|uniref:Formamidopyrimidine-DNA glycosylase n=1 Tax=Neoroseomonas alkaliterrae TaxID=1452450 RepID=A0A840XV42_9PROT|nr:bifunctional DNA-formamidopyrimidine glycosylase/DNA-(apurinic or apyrimidinic site) lyase [Neoroseomonas alkaliterrae]MBB5688017.1 formamidopyrimidine-DNA glycosylase [Neoroseomonas alkaliterrae]MBR0676833.1 bifunctional DNA-formamidopyrimidine glycosylase/DNA-(apurinic or apyrimidinic site) lyase [Neoroseomonas alkaliterrae]
MPELPEVETVMRGLAAVLQGHRITEVEVRRHDLRFPFPKDLARRMEGRRVLSFRRRAKYMLMRLEGGESVLIHLGMSGRMVARRAGEVPARRIAPQGAASDARGHNAPPEAHEHLVIVTDHGWRVGFVDPRRFGAVDLVPTAQEDAHRLLQGLGPEPLEEAFTPAVLSAALRGKRTPIKAALLDQGVVAGLGNIYVCEALFRAGISPRRVAASVAGARAERLVPAIKAVLAESIGAGGSSLRDYVRADGEVGRFQENFAVYGREGEPCPACPGVPPCPGIRRIVQAGRSTFFCPRRQR